MFYVQKRRKEVLSHAAGCWEKRVDCKNVHPCSDMVTLVPALTLTILSLLGNTCLGHKEALAETSEKATVRKCCPWGQTYDAWYNCVHLPGGARLGKCF